MGFLAAPGQPRGIVTGPGGGKQASVCGRREARRIWAIQTPYGTTTEKPVGTISPVAAAMRRRTHGDVSAV